VLDGLLLRAQFVAVPWIKGRSWRSGMAAERVVQSVHEALRRTARRAGWLGGERLPVEDEGPGCALPVYPDFVPRMSGVSDIAQLLVSGTWRRRDGSIGPLDELSWVRDGYGNISSLDRLSFHSLRWAMDLFDAFDATQDSTYLHAGLSLVGQWIRECLDSEDVFNVWSDHATALRAIVLCQAWHRRGKLLDSGAARQLREAAVRHAQKLALDCFYRPDHDHGVTQAYGQLALGLSFKHASAAPAWVTQGLARLECQMRDNVTSGGVLKEHSPYYQLYVLQQFYYAYEVGCSGGADFSPPYVERLSHMAQAAIETLKPDGTLSAFGDTAKASAIVIDPSSVLTALGASGSRFETGRRAWIEGGYAVFRSGHNPAERASDERFLMVRCANFPMPHLHDDLLSFEFSAYGDDLIVDSGGPFQYAHPARVSYFTRAVAHNTIVLDGADEVPLGSARIICRDSQPEGDVFVAERTAAPGVLHTRALCFVHTGYLVLIDTITSRAPRTIRSLLHLNPALDAVLEGTSLRSRRSSEGPRVSVVPLHGSDVAGSLSRGEETPLQGWVCTGMGRMMPGSVLEYRSSGTDVVLACVIAAERQPGSAVRATVAGNLAEFSGRIAVDLGDDRHEIVLSSPWRIRIEKHVRSGLVR
jgi:hypothetical protein